MALLEFLLYQFFFIVLITIITIYVLRSVNMDEANDLSNLPKILGFGFIGWIIAYLRIIIIQVYQIILLINAGVDISNQDEIMSAAIVGTYTFNIIGPLLSGIFEEGVRYWLLMKVVGDAKNRIDRKYIPLLFGLSWAYSEILILTLGFLSVEAISLGNLLISGYERLVAMFIHVSFTYLVLYAKFTNKKTLWISVIIHTIYNSIALVLIMELGLSNDTILPIELALTVLAIIVVFFTYKYLKPIEESINLNSEDTKPAANETSPTT